MPSKRALRAGATNCCNESLILRVNESCIGGYAATTGVFGKAEEGKEGKFGWAVWFGHAGVWLFDFTWMGDGVYFTSSSSSSSSSFLYPRFMALGFKISKHLFRIKKQRSMDSIRLKCLLFHWLRYHPLFPSSTTTLCCMQDIPRQLPNLDFVHPMFQTPQKLTSPHARPCESLSLILLQDHHKPSLPTLDNTMRMNRWRQPSTLVSSHRLDLRRLLSHSSPRIP
jgi:hypothetical protein